MAIEKISIEIKSNAEEVKKQLSDIDDRIKKLKDSKAEIQLIKAEKLEAAKKSIEHLNVAIKKLQAQKAELKVSSEPADVAKKKMQELQRSIDILKASKARLQVDTQQLKGADKDLNKLDKEMTQLNNKKARLQVEQQDIIETERGLSGLRTKLSQLNTTKTKIDISSNISSIGSQLDGLSNKMFGMLNPLKSKLSQWIGIGAAVKAVNSAVSLVTGSLDSAISRYDTLNNFPKVMSNLKISEDAAQASIDKLSEELTGLPTTLNDAAASVQRFTSGNRDIEKSTDMFLALNNAILAGGLGADIQSSALEQISQAYAKGKPDMVEWRSILTAMPAQAAQIGEAFGMTSDELGEALRYGNISMDEFMDKIIELNTVGANGYLTFAEQARNATGGIKTSLTVMKTRITAGLTDLIRGVDKILGKTNLGSLSNIFVGIGNAFKSGFDKIGQVMNENEDKIVAFVNTVQEKASALWDGVKRFDWKSLWDGFKESVTELKESAQTMLETFKPILDFAKDRITDLGDGNLAKGLGKLPALFLKVAAGAKVLGKIFKGLGKITDFKLPSIFGGKDKSGEGSTGFNFDTGKMLNQAKNMALIFGAIKIVEEVAQALKDINDKVPKNLFELGPKLINVGIAIVGMGALIAIAGKLVKGNMKTAIKGLAAVAGISLELMLVAEALKQINDKVPKDLSKLCPKLINMGIAIAGMGALVAVAGLLATANSAAAVTGLAVVAAISLELMLAAEAMQQIDEKVPSGIVDFAKKLANMAIAIVGMGVIVGAVGTLMATGVGALIAGAGLATVALFAGELILVAEAIKQVDEKVPGNLKGVKSKVDGIAEVIGCFTYSNLGSEVDLFNNFIGAINISVVTAGIGKMIELSSVMSEFEGKRINEKLIRKGIKDIERAIGIFTNSRLGNIFTLFKNFISGLNIKVVNEAIKQMNELSDALGGLKKVDSKNIKEKIKSIETVFLAITKSKLGNITTMFTNFVSGLNLEVVSSAIESMMKLPKTLSLLKGVEVEVFARNLKSIEEAFSLFTNSRLGNAFTGIKNFLSKENIKVVDKALATMAELPAKFKMLRIVDIESVAKKVKSIEEAFDIITSAEFGGMFSIVEDFFSEKNLEVALETIKVLLHIGTGLSKLQKIKVNTAIIETTVASITAAIKMLDKEGFALDEMATAESLKEVTSAVGEISNICEKINLIGELNPDVAITTIASIKRVLEELNTLPGVIDVELLDSISTSIGNLISVLSEMESSFNEVGTNYGNELIAGFDSADVGTAITNLIDDLVKKLLSKKNKFKDIGKMYGEELKKAFTSAVNNMHTAVDVQIKKMSNYSMKFNSLGTTLGNSLVKGFNAAVANLSSNISTQVSSIQRNLNSLSVPSLAQSGGAASPVYVSNGGLIPQYLSGGGIAGTFKKRGTDTVPAMLTPGEFVQNKKAVGMFGTEFMSRINNLDLSGALKSLTGNFNSQSTMKPAAAAVITNISNERINNARVNQTIHNGNPNHSLRRANRYVKSL